MDDVDLIRHALDLYAAGDMDAALALAADDAEFRPVFIEGTYTGIDAIRELLKGVGDPRDRWRAVDLEFERVGRHVLVTGRLQVAASLGGAMDFPIAWLFTVERGRVARMESYIDRRKALEAVCGEPPPQ
jgi:ketosteroid isomerase-like protein